MISFVYRHTILGHLVGGSGEKARRKFSSKGGRAPGYLRHYFKSVKWILASDLIGHKRSFALLCPMGEQHLLSSFWVFVHDGYCNVVLVLKLTQLSPVAAYCRQVLLSLGTDGIFCWLLRGHQWWWLQAQLLYSSTDALPLFSCPNIFHFSLFFKSYSMVKWACDIYYNASLFSFLSSTMMPGLLCLILLSCWLQFE